MSFTRALSAVGLIRPTRRRGFCPACRLWANAPSGEQHVELAPPALTVLASLLVAAIAWALVLRQSRAGRGMAMGPSSLESFSTSWVVMMAAMMLPSAMPLVFEFARGSEGRRGWRAATGVLGLTYLSMWLAFGLVCYVVEALVPTPLSSQRVVGGVALVLAGLYGLTSIKRSSEARCRELCALHGPCPSTSLGAHWSSARSRSSQRSPCLAQRARWAVTPRSARALSTENEIARARSGGGGTPTAGTGRGVSAWGEAGTHVMVVRDGDGT